MFIFSDKSENENSDAEMATDENKENGTTTMEDEFKLEDYDKNKGILLPIILNVDYYNNSNITQSPFFIYINK